MKIDNQKNGVRGGLIHHDSLHHYHCPVRALARRVHHIMSHKNGKREDIISTFFSHMGMRHCVTTNAINTAIKNAVDATGLSKHGFSKASVTFIMCWRRYGNAPE